MLLRLQCHTPYLETQIVPGASFNPLNQVEVGNIDLAVVIKPDFVLTKNFYSEPMPRESFVLVTPPGMKGEDQIALLRDAPFIRYDRTLFGGRIVNHFLHCERLTPKISLEIDKVDTIMIIVEHNIGVALVPLAESLTLYRELIVVIRCSWRQSPLHQLITGFSRAAAPGAQSG